MAGRPRYYNEDELIDKAIEVFWKKGYTASSAKDLMQAMDIGQGSFYLTFKGGKKELYQKSLKYFWSASIKQFRASAKKSENPVLFLKNFFFSIVNRSKQQAINGCYLGNALVEFSNLDDETRILSEKLLSKFEKEFEKVIKLAQERGKISTEKCPIVLAKYLINLWNGINITSRMKVKNQQLEDMIEMNLKVLS